MMNEKSAAILVVLAWSGGLAFSQSATSHSEATAHIHARIEPRIAVSEPALVEIDLQDRMTGSVIPAEARFTVQANTQEVEFQVACTDLCKAGDPASEHRIPVAGPGAQITCEQAGSRLLAWLTAPPANALPTGWTGRVSEGSVFAAPGRRAFNQEVAVEVSWQTTDSTLPTGEYQGIVRLLGMVRP
jgi:hypothetical protein